MVGRVHRSCLHHAWHMLHDVAFHVLKVTLEGKVDLTCKGQLLDNRLRLSCLVLHDY